jgi:hypothetical protein
MARMSGIIGSSGLSIEMAQRLWNEIYIPERAPLRESHHDQKYAHAVLVDPDLFDHRKYD